ncbi:DEAD/DEAH box helicase [Jannaschia sp. 2305UL9-9]|uniref:DEAD/DEAH box helicase n=1 Tax=Jannaschia sp. 2305UL9-9 TaxID=3121638 RepID=UPI003528FCF7
MTVDTTTGEDLPRCLKIAEDLHTGDLMVHEDHGLGRFAGLDTAAGSEVIRLEFAEGASLLVPVTEAGTLWRHGSCDTGMALDDLGGSAWKRRSATLRRRVSRAAGRLVRAARAREAAEMPVIEPGGAAVDHVAAGFRWEETPDQQAAIDAILSDLASGRGMDRLLVGDVGFGKTEVALRAIAAAAGAGVQVAVLAPTTILVRQHLETLTDRLAGTGLTVAGLSRLDPPAAARDVRDRLRAGRIDVVVGTHALLTPATAFADLGLIVVDEEQRFGKAHKTRLRRLTEGAHVLSMTATPIPGSLQQALIGIQDLSVLATAPTLRHPVRTAQAPLTDAVLHDALTTERARGGQSFVVVPRIADIDAARDRIARACPDLSLRVVHGDLSARDLDAQMRAFAEGDGDVLLATTLIESGLDVPRANTMLVLQPERFGLTQLHQLRGRIGRGDAQAICLLLSAGTETRTADARRRLDTLVRQSGLGAGFALSRIDLDLRGGGDPSGADQSGHDARIGPALHADLLASALRRARGLPARSRPAVHLEVTAHLPEAYVNDPDTRATLYNRLGHARTLSDLGDLRHEVTARFGPMPTATDALFDIAALRLRAADLGVEGLSAGPEVVAIDLPRGACPDPLPQSVTRSGRRLLQHGDHADFAGQVAALSRVLDVIAAARA